jgi:hypothetical protein
LRNIDAAHTVTVAVNGEAPFPGIVVDQNEKRLRVYDLSSPLPVLRTFTPPAQVTQGSAWRHGQAIAGYSEKELGEIRVYLQSAAAR